MTSESAAPWKANPSNERTETLFHARRIFFTSRATASPSVLCAGASNTCGFGAFAEYVAVPESVLAQKPANISFEEAAAAVQAAQVALQALRDTGRIQKGQKVLVYGASGGIGSFAVQIAKAFEADVTAVCSTRNVELARSLGADRVIDYTQEDFLKNGQRFDLILATAGYRSIFEFKRVLSPRETMSRPAVRWPAPRPWRKSSRPCSWDRCSL